MIAVTSISPTHVNKGQQKRAVDSWVKLGIKVYSLNNSIECEQLAKEYLNVKFIPTNRTMEHLYGKPYVMISAAFDFAKTQVDDNICFINSDIELICDEDLINRISKKLENKMILVNRVNHVGDYLGSQYTLGIDVFFIHKKMLSLFNQSMHCFGQCFWDYWVPFKAINSGIEVEFIKQDIAFHLSHDAQYSEDNWKKAGRYFLWENNLYQFCDTTGIAKMSKFIYSFIYNACKRVEI